MSSELTLLVLVRTLSVLNFVASFFLLIKLDGRSPLDQTLLVNFSNVFTNYALQESMVVMIFKHFWSVATL